MKQPDSTTAARRPNSGQFRKGPDPRRHTFTQAERSDGVGVAVESIVARHPDAVDRHGRHMVCNFLRSKRGGRAAR